jgi:hypothetical protein
MRLIELGASPFAPKLSERWVPPQFIESPAFNFSYSPLADSHHGGYFGLGEKTGLTFRPGCANANRRFFG